MEALGQVLLVEDEPLIAEVVEATLSDAGFPVLTCGTGEDAIAHLERDITKISVVLTDIRMPGVDGWDVAHRARELAGNIAVIYVTGDSAEEWPSKGVPNSVLIQKPFVGAQIITAISNLLNKANVTG